MQPIKDDRSFLKLLLLSIITLGIYEFWHLHHWTKDINTLCKDDGKNNEGVLLYILFTLVTCGLFPIFWWFKAADRLARDAETYILSVIRIFIWYAQYLVMRATNDLATDYNSKHVYAKSVVDGTDSET